MVDGSLIFDTKVDTTGFTKGSNTLRTQAGNLTSVFTKLGGIIAGAFAVGKLIQFGNEAINLASDLTEVQNVVDTAFGSMSYKMEAFADTCIETFGMSKLTAKEMGSTFMAMANGMGQASDTASDMAVEITGRMGDIMSFYNKTASEVNTIGKAIYTGETEPLKAIGVVMTETNLNTYTLAHGYKQLYKDMAPADKLLVRQKFFLDATNQSAGDFVKTQDSWANQTRILSERWKEFMGILGNALINVLTPVVKTLNDIVSGLINVGNELSNVFGISMTSNVAQQANDATGSIEAMGDAIEDTQAKANGGTAGFDQLNVLSGSEAAGDTGVTATSMATTALEEQADATSNTETETSKLQVVLQGLGDTVKTLGDTFKTSFKDTFGNKSSWSGITANITSLKDSFLAIFSESEMQAAASTWVSTMATNIGSQAGATASIGTSIAGLLTGGMKLYMDENKESVQGSIISLIDISSRATEIGTNFNNAIACIFTAFQSEGAQQIIADIIEIFSSAFFGVTELIGQFGVDVIGLITAPFIDNQELITTTIENTFSAVAPFFETIKNTVDDVFTALKEVYVDNVAPVIESFKQGFSDIANKVLEAYNQYILPVIEYAAEKFEEFRTGPLAGLIEKFKEFAAKVCECITTIWVNFLQPFICWFIKNIAPVISGVLKVVIDVFFLLWEGISSVVGFIFDALGGLLDFITGIFSGDWDKAWNGIKDFFVGIWNAIVAIFTTIIDTIVGIFTNLINIINDNWGPTWENVKNIFKNIWESIKNVFNIMKNTISGIMSSISSGISTALATIKEKFVSIFTSIKTTVTNIFTGIWNAIKGVINSILGGIEGMANGVVNGINTVVGAMNNLSFDIPDWVPGLGGQTFGFNISKLSEVSLPRLATGTVVPPNFGEFAAILGDNKREAEVVSPVSTMKQAFKEALAEMGGVGGDISLIVELDGDVVYRTVVKKDRQYKKQYRKSAFAI